MVVTPYSCRLARASADLHCSNNALRLRQSGAALLLALLIVTLVSTLASAMVWQQWRAVQVEVAERSRVQSSWILAGALDWARLILREDARSGRPTALGEPWAQPLVEVRLSTFLAADADRTDDAPEAFLSGEIKDAQARYNLRNLVVGGKVVPAELAVLQRLFGALGLNAAEADRIANGLRDAAPPVAPGASAPSDGATAQVGVDPAGRPLAPLRIEQLGWLGVEPATLRRIAAHVVLLPQPTPVNLNTASREVVAAVIDGLDPAGAGRVLQSREREAFKTVADARQALGPTFTLSDPRVGVTSRYFEVRGQLRLSDRVLEQTVLVERRQLEIVVITADRPRSVPSL